MIETLSLGIFSHYETTKFPHCEHSIGIRRQSSFGNWNTKPRRSPISRKSLEYVQAPWLRGFASINLLGIAKLGRKWYHSPSSASPHSSQRMRTSFSDSYAWKSPLRPFSDPFSRRIDTNREAHSGCTVDHEDLGLGHTCALQPSTGSETAGLSIRVQHLRQRSLSVGCIS